MKLLFIGFCFGLCSCVVNVPAKAIQYCYNQCVNNEGVFSIRESMLGYILCQCKNGEVIDAGFVNDIKVNK